MMPFNTQPNEKKINHGPDTDRPKDEFDPDLRWDNPVNLRVAETRGLRYDPKSKYYKDADGCLVRDSYGQSL
mgnify:CR=1 FL=1